MIELQAGVDNDVEKWLYRSQKVDWIRAYLVDNVLLMASALERSLVGAARLLELGWVYYNHLFSILFLVGQYILVNAIFHFNPPYKCIFYIYNQLLLHTRVIVEHWIVLLNLFVEEILKVLLGREELAKLFVHSLALNWEETVILLDIKVIIFTYLKVAHLFLLNRETNLFLTWDDIWVL